MFHAAFSLEPPVRDDLLGDILLVEDERALREVLALFLENAGYAVRAVETAREAADLLAAGRVGLIITDLVMPDGDGLELLFALRDRRTPIPVIAMSGGSLVDAGVYLKMASKLGARATLAKPFELADLLTAVQAAIGQPRR